MLGFMVVEAGALPAAPTRGIVVMVVGFVMDGESVQSFAVEFTSTVGTNPGEEFQRGDR